MDKYTILILLNMPIVLLGLLRAYTMYHKRTLNGFRFAVRLGFWAIIALGILFAQDIYFFLQRHNLTDTQPLSLADVVLFTGVNFCLIVIVKLYSKIEALDKKVTDLHQELSIRLSEHK